MGLHYVVQTPRMEKGLGYVISVGLALGPSFAKYLLFWAILWLGPFSALYIMGSGRFVSGLYWWQKSKVYRLNIKV